jgi:phosphatidylglycerophosphate synthase
MHNLFGILLSALLPVLLIIIYYVIILTRKGEMRRTKFIFGSGRDWITFITVILGATSIASGIIELGFKPPVIWMLALIVLLFIYLFIRVILRARAGKPILRPMGDERINAISAKSARNAFCATYVIFFILPLFNKSYTMDATWYVGTLAAGLVVFLASYYFYYYREE